MLKTLFCVSFSQCNEELVSPKHRAVARCTNVFPGNWDVVTAQGAWRTTGSLPVGWPPLYTAQWNSISFFCRWQHIAVPSLLQFGCRWWSFKTELCRVLLHASLKHRIRCTFTPVLLFFSRHIALYPSQCRVPCLWELWREFSSLKSFVSKSRTPETVCSKKGS